MEGLGNSPNEPKTYKLRHLRGLCNNPRGLLIRSLPDFLDTFPVIYNTVVTCGLFPQANEWHQTHCCALGPTVKALPNTGRLFALLILGSIVFHLTSFWGLSSASANRACQNKSSCPAHPAVGSCKTDRPHCELESSCPVCFGSCKLQHLALDGRIESDKKNTEILQQAGLAGLDSKQNVSKCATFHSKSSPPWPSIR